MPLDPTLIDTLAQPQPLDNMGGLVEIQLAYTDWLTNLPDPIQNVVNAAPTFASGYAMIGLPAVEDTLRWQEEATGPNADQVKTTFAFNVARDRTDLRQTVPTIARHALVVTGLDSNNVLRRMGTLTVPARMSWAFDTQAAARGRNEYTCTITWISDEPCPIVDTNYVPDFSHMTEEESGGGGGIGVGG